MKRIGVLLAKEVAQIRWDPMMLQVLIAAPLFQLFVLGLAATTDVRQIEVGIRDLDRSWHSREYVRALGASGHMVTRSLSGGDGEDERRLVSGRAALVVIIPPDFSRNLTRSQPAAVQVLVDGSDSNLGVQGLNYLMKATRLFNERTVREVVGERAAAGLSLPGVTPETRAWFNPDLLSRQYMVPAIMGVLLLVTTTLVSSMALVREREEGTMEQLIVTPLRVPEIMLGKLLPFAAIGLISVTLALPVVVFVFGAPLRGSLVTFYVMTGLFLISTLGLGLFVSTLAHTQQQAMTIAAFFVMMPFVLLSGFIFPVENMPPFFQRVAALIPLKYYLVVVRGIFLKGAGWAELWPQAVRLLAWGAAIQTLAVLKFHKRLD